MKRQNKVFSSHTNNCSSLASVLPVPGVRIKVHSYPFIPQVLGELTKSVGVHYLYPIFMGNKECRAAVWFPCILGTKSVGVHYLAPIYMGNKECTLVTIPMWDL